MGTGPYEPVLKASTYSKSESWPGHERQCWLTDSQDPKRVRVYGTHTDGLSIGIEHSYILKRLRGFGLPMHCELLEFAVK